MKRILIVDDDTELCDLLAKFLARENFETAAVHNGEEGLAKALTGEFQMVILDVMLPDASGFDVLRRIRAASQIPVLMLTARGEEIDRVVGLEIGADDYLAKPFGTRELVARLNAILRRYEFAPNHQSAAPEKLTVADLTIETEARTVRVGGAVVEMTTAEYDILLILAHSAGKIVPREELAKLGLGKSLAPFDRSVDMIISKIRRKLGNLSGDVERIRSVRNSGYIYARSGEPPN